MNNDNMDGVPGTTIEVYSGFYVNEADVVPKPDYYDVSKERVRIKKIKLFVA